MDWPNEPYVRLYTRETADDLELSWNALALWHLLLRRFDRSGLVEARNGWSSIAKVVRADTPGQPSTQSIVEAGAELVRDGRVRLVKGGVYAPNFMEAQSASKSDKARQKESRDRRRARAESEEVVLPPSNHAVALPTSHAVTNGHEPVTPSHSLLCSADPLLSSALLCIELPPNESAKSDSAQLAEIKAKVDKAPKAKRGNRISADWKPRTEERAWASQQGIDCDAEAEHFRDHHVARGSSFVDWDASFRTWLRNHVKWGKPKQSNQGALDVALRYAGGNQ